MAVNAFVFGVVAAFAAEFVLGFMIIMVAGCVNALKHANNKQD